MPERHLRIDDLELEARERLPAMVFDYYAGGAGDELTLEENRAAFDRWLLRPRMLRGISEPDVSTTVLGQAVASPILIAPTAFQAMAHPDGELAMARAAARAGTVMVLSTIATYSIEDVAAAAPGSPRWFQLYIHRDRELTARLVRRADAAGYGAIVLTVDAPYLGRRYRDERNAFALPPGVRLANLADIPLPASEGSSLFAYFAAQLDPSITWEDIAWLRDLSSLPVLVKGVLTGEDAALAIDAGADGLIVSNHGGRQLDGVPAAVDALPEVVDAVRGRAEVLMDGGVRRGTDVVKALALGARAVLVGRPCLWGLAVGGEEGASTVLRILAEELRLAMALAGVARADAVDDGAVVRAPR